MEKNMEQPLVSVVIPIYRVEAYLDRCIESVISQTYHNLEIILVDDGSPDRCPEMCDGWAERDNRIKAVHKTNAGLGMARNTGIEHATGKYIFFLDSDDYWVCDTVQHCVNCAEQENADVVLFGSYNAYDDGRIEKNTISLHQPLYQGDEIRTQLLSGLFTYRMGIGISAWSKMFQLSIIRTERLRFVSEREIISEDAFFVLEYFSKIKKAVVLNENLYCYFKRRDSLTAKCRTDRQEKNNIFLQKSIEYIEERNLPEIVAECMTARYHMYTMSHLKQLMASDMEGKKEQIFAVLRDPYLQSTLSRGALKHENGNLKLFFTMLHMKCYSLCYFLLYVRTHKS